MFVSPSLDPAIHFSSSFCSSVNIVGRASLLNLKFGAFSQDGLALLKQEKCFRII